MSLRGVVTPLGASKIVQEWEADAQREDLQISWMECGDFKPRTNATACERFDSSAPESSAEHAHAADEVAGTAVVVDR